MGGVGVAQSTSGIRHRKAEEKKGIVLKSHDPISSTPPGNVLWGGGKLRHVHCRVVAWTVQVHEFPYGSASSLNALYCSESWASFENAHGSVSFGPGWIVLRTSIDANPRMMCFGSAKLAKHGLNIAPLVHSFKWHEESNRRKSLLVTATGKVASPIQCVCKTVHPWAEKVFMRPVVTSPEGMFTFADTNEILRLVCLLAPFGTSDGKSVKAH
ncbi:uncharacterized protein EV422DRAFT_510501 [Fimicolochytrium jonesii]|uniref:uncharacterized protein n=1 Tax=Fimicolochytrium jonesii TaxID=1396493 RepID=UPI0022FEB72B|nr:uncharacterized protein EV422DRAFT_510501 [Fimicolochytrium jonesii]KAI8815549.1 hypothetical protein EV422DRAFT_510501 [Fimicolochytrium jonesii]